MMIVDSFHNGGRHSSGLTEDFLITVLHIGTHVYHNCPIFLICAWRKNSYPYYYKQQVNFESFILEKTET